MSTAQRVAEMKALVNATFKKDIMKLGSDPYFKVTYLPTGIVAVDHLLQGGIPFGRFVEVFGDYSTLKTYVGLKAIAQCQKMGKIAGLIDTEHSFDPAWAKAVGVNVDELLLADPGLVTNGEEAMDLMEIWIRGGVDLIVVDSIAATLPKAEQEKSMTDSMQPARLASLMSAACRKLTAANGKTAVFWINQTRVNVGVMFGTNEAVPGGKAMGFYSSMRLAFRKAGRETEELEVFVTNDGKPTKKKVKRVVGQRIRITLEKSKLNAPHRDVEVIFDHRTGAIDDWHFLANLGLEHGLLGYQKGYWWVADGTKTPQKSYLSAFRGRVSEADLVTMLTKTGVQHLGGESEPAKKRAVSRRSASSRSAVPASTRAAGQAASRKTGLIRKRSTK